MDNKKKYMLVYIKTGNGHLAPAQAIFNYINKYFSNIAEPYLFYGFEKAPKWLRLVIEGGYNFFQFRLRWLYEFIYLVNKIPLIGKTSCRLVTIFIVKQLEKEIKKYKPDVIIIFHALLINPIQTIVKKGNLKVKVLTLVTDPFTPPSLWLFWEEQSFIVFSKKLENKVREITKHSVVKSFPFVVDNRFSETLSLNEVISLKRNYGYDSDKKMLLILGGGDGIPKGEKILEELLKSNINSEIGIVCGKNEVLQEGAEHLKKKYVATNLKIYGYVDFIYELINISDVVLTKCGASTIMEILNLKKIPVVNDYIWEQEQGNVDYLIEKKLGIYEPKIKKLPIVIKNLLEDEKQYSSYKENIIKEKIENGVSKAAEYIIG